MHLDVGSLKKRCGAKGLPLGEALRRAGVSRTAYYSLTRKESVLPQSIVRLARFLEVAPSELLRDGIAEAGHVRELREQAERIRRKSPGCDGDVIFRTLQNLELPPVERLRRALIRAPRRDVLRR
jgi:transcriptional regulator with XRE-family HTH domain